MIARKIETFVPSTAKRAAIREHRTDFTGSAAQRAPAPERTGIAVHRRRRAGPHRRPCRGGGGRGAGGTPGGCAGGALDGNTRGVGRGNGTGGALDGNAGGKALPAACGAAQTGCRTESMTAPATAHTRSAAALCAGGALITCHTAAGCRRAGRESAARRNAKGAG